MQLLLMSLILVLLIRSQRLRPQRGRTNLHALVQSPCNQQPALLSRKLTPSSEGLGFDSACPPGFRIQLHLTTSLSTGGGPVSYVQLSEGGFQVVYPLGLWSRFSGVVKVLYGYG